MGAEPETSESLSSVASGKADWSLAVNGLAANGYGDHSPGKYALGSGLLIEVVLTFGFIVVILGSTDRRAPAGFAPIAIGFAPHWFEYLEVDDVDACLKLATDHGGKIMRPPFDMSDVGRLGFVRDSAGAAVGLMTPVRKA